jgi:hypothetical protein
LDLDRSGIEHQRPEAVIERLHFVVGDVDGGTRRSAMRRTSYSSGALLDIWRARRLRRFLPTRTAEPVAASFSERGMPFGDRLAEQEFAKEIAKALDHAHFNALILVAPARTLADLRTALSEKTRRAIVSEIDKDLTKHPVYEIERHLTGG